MFLDVVLEEVLHLGLDGVVVYVHIGVVGSIVVLGESIQLVLCVCVW